MATRCCWPPESVAIGRSRRSARPSRSSVSSSAAAHHGRREAQQLHAVGEFVLDRVRDEVGQRVLAHRADHVRELARFVGAGVPPGDRDPAAQGAAREVRHETGDHAEHGRLADAGGPHERRPASGTSKSTPWTVGSTARRTSRRHPRSGS